MKVRNQFHPRRFFVLTMLLAACSTDQCDCEGWEAREYPASKIEVTIPSAGQVRVTSSGLDYIEDQVPYLITQVLPGGLSFCIPRDTSGNPDLCAASTCTSGVAGCQVDVTLDDQSITPNPPNQLDVSITIGDIDEQLDFDYDTFLGEVNCYVQLFKKGSSESTPAQVVGSLPITLDVDGASPTKELRVGVGDPVVDLDTLDFKIHGRGNVGDTVACGGASLVRGLFRGMIEREVVKALDGAVSGVADEQLCTRCGGDFGTCDAGTCEENICRYSSGVCIPRPLGIEGRLALGALIGDYTRAPNSGIDVLAKAGDHAIVDSGVSVGLRAGFDPIALSSCVPVDPTQRPSTRVVPVSSVINANTKPQGGDFHMSVGLHKSAVENVLWSAWGSGASCLEVSGDDVMLLSAATFSIVAPSIRDFASGSSYAYIAVVPQKTPAVTFGANRIVEAGETYTIQEPLLTLNWDDLDFHVFINAQDRLLRMFTLRVDLELPVAIAPDGSGNLIPVIGDIESAIQNVRTRRTELLAEDAQRISDLVPTLVGTAAPQLVGILPESIAVPEFLGFELALGEGDITAVDKDAFIAVFATLARTNSPQVLGAPIPIVLAHEVDLSVSTESGLIRPQVWVDVGVLPSALSTMREVEYSHRVDGGIWSRYERTSRLLVNNALLVLPGHHTIELRARERGVIGVASPALAFDVEINPEQVLFRMNELAQADLSDSLPLEAVAVAPTQVVPLQVTSGAAGGCSTTNSSLSFLSLFLVMGVFLRRKRLALLGIVALVGIGCQGDVTSNARTCFGAACGTRAPCEVDSDCTECPSGSGGICEDNICQCVTACVGGCGEGTFCCLSSGTCADLTPECGSTCDAGYEARVVGEPNRETCAIDGACECVALPPVPTGVHGMGLDIASNGNGHVVAAYNKTYKDLMLGQIAADGAIDWWFAAGMPEGGEITGDPAFREGTAELGPKVGDRLAVALAPDGTIHVVYRDIDNDALLLSSGQFRGPLTTLTLDDAQDANYPSMAMVGDELHIVFSWVDGNRSGLRHVKVVGAAMEVVGEIVEDAFSDLTDKGYERRVGAFADLSATPTDGLFVVFYNGSTPRVGRAEFDGSAWAAPEYLSVNTGPYASGMIDAQGRQHVVFMMGTGLRYTRFFEGSSEASGLVRDTVRDTGDEYYTGPTGENVHLSLLANNDVQIVWHDAFDLSLNVAAGSNGEDWDLQNLRPVNQATGMFSKSCRSCDWYVDFVVDRSNEADWGFVRATAR